MFGKTRFKASLPFVGLAVTLSCLCILFLPTLLNLIDDWSTPEYSHGFILPFLAGLMIWHRLAGWNSEVCPHVSGIVIIAVSLILLLVSQISTFRQLSYISIILSLFGLILNYYGFTIAKRLLPAFILLIFAVPLPFMIYNTLSLHLKLVSTSLGVFLIDLCGFSVFQDGNIIDLGTYQLQVVDACNGLRYLFPATSFGFIIAYLLQDSWWKRVVIFLSSVPITIAMNAVRIAVVGVTVNLWGIDAAEGFIHIFEGYVVFLLCIAILMGETILLARIGNQGGFDWSFFTIPEDKIIVRPKLEGAFGFTTAALCLAGLTLSFIVLSDSTKQRAESKLYNLQLPLEQNGWKGQEMGLSSYLLNELKLSDYLLADYRRDLQTGEPAVNLYIAYYSRQQIGSTIHSPETCLPGGGWQTLESEVVSWSPPGSGMSLPLTRTIISKGRDKLVVYYWFHERGRDLTSQFEAKWYLLVDSLLTGRSDGSLIRLITAVGPGEDEDRADARLRDYLRDFYPAIMQTLPDPATENTR